MPATDVARLLASARSALQDARTGTAPERFATAHLAALRAAAAVLASKPSDERHRRPTSVWVLLAAAAPDLHEWTDRFAASAEKRAAAQAGLRSAVTDADAEAMVADAATFVDVVAQRVER